MTINGLSRFHQRSLKSYLSEHNIDGEFELQFKSPISLRRLDSFWYGGDMLIVKYKGYIFSIEAIGDVYARVCSANDGSYIAHAKDKHNKGDVGSEMRPYFRSDKTLHSALEGGHRLYRVEMDNNNWWECIVIDPQGGIHDLMWVLDDDNLFLGIFEVLVSLDGIIEELEEEAL